MNISSDGRAELLLDAPVGIRQDAGDTGLSLACAFRAENIDTRGGCLASCAGVSRAFPSLGAAAQTLARFVRRNRPEDPEVFVAAAGTKIYTWTAGTAGWVLRGEGFSGEAWSTVTYETARDGETEDVLLMTNAQDGMVVLYGGDLSLERVSLSIGSDYGQVRFSHLCRFAERIWGVGAPGYPDSLFYSCPYDPLDWTENSESPELGGGVIRQPTWDGERFLALARLGQTLVAVKPQTVFEIRGTDPSSFVITESFGSDGPAAARTIAADGDRLFWLARDGIGVYDDAGARLLDRDAVREIMDARSSVCSETAAACVSGHVLYLALALDGSPVNNAVLELDLLRDSYMLRTGLAVGDLYALDGKVYYTDAYTPYEILRYGDPDAGGDLGEPIRGVWETGWQEAESSCVKRNFILRFFGEADGENVPLRLVLETPEGECVRTALLQKRRKAFRLSFRARGRRFRLRLEGGPAVSGWRLPGGIRVGFDMEEDTKC